MKKIFIFIFVLFLFLSSLAWATDYYVRPASGEYGGEDGSSYAAAYDGESDIVWADVDSGNGKLFICGTHYQTFTPGVNGEDGTPIQLVSCTIANGATNDDPGIIDGGGSRDTAIDLDARSWITIDGISTQNHSGGTLGAIQAATWGTVTEGIIIKNVSVIEANKNGISISANNSTIENSTIDVGSGQPATVTDALFLTWAGSYNQGQNITVDGNTIYQRNGNGTAHHDALQTHKNLNTVIKNNWIQAFDGNADSQTAMIEDHLGTLYVYNNVFVHNTNGNFNGAFLLWDNGSIWTADIYMWNNVVYNPKSGGWGTTFYVPAGDVKEVKNNIFISNNDYAIWFQSTPSTKTGIDYNCLYSGASALARDGGGDKTWAQWTSAGYDDDGGINTDPSLDANYAPDAADDPVVDVGADLSVNFTTDKNGVTRTVFDIGAYEWVGVEPTGAHITIHSSITVHDSLTISE